MPRRFANKYAGGVCRNEEIGYPRDSPQEKGLEELPGRAQYDG